MNNYFVSQAREIVATLYYTKSKKFLHDITIVKRLCFQLIAHFNNSLRVVFSTKPDFVCLN